MKLSANPEAAFLSEVTAGATHELRNVLAIIKESGGLMGDLVRLHPDAESLDQGRFGRAVDRVEAQVRRGAEILTKLNRLSHSLDVDRATLDLREEADLIVFLTERRARNRRHTLEGPESSADAPLTASPIHLQMALYAVLNLCIDELPEGSNISVGVDGGSRGPSVLFKWDTGADQAPSTFGEGTSWGEAQALVAVVGGRMEPSPERQGIMISFGAI